MEVKARRQLSLFDMTCIGVNTIIGSSIFLFPGKVAALLGPASILCFLFVGILLLAIAYSFAEASSYFSGPGGAYLYCREAFGERVGYGVGWLSWTGQIFAWGAVANGISTYLTNFHPVFHDWVAVKAVAAGIIVFLGVLNYRGVKLGAWTSDFFTIAKLIPLTLFVVVGVFSIQPSHLVPFAPQGYGSFGAACFLVYFAYQGFENIPAPAGEAVDPHRTIPKAILFSFVICMTFYLLIQTIAMSAVPDLATSDKPLAYAASAVLGPWAGSFMAVGAVISMIGYNTSSALSSPRYVLALSEGGHWPSRIARFHPKFGTPGNAVLFSTVVSASLAFFLDFKTLVDFCNVATSFQYTASCGAVVALRKQRRQSPLNRGLGKWMPYLGMAAALWLGSQASWTEIRTCIGVAVLGYVIVPVLRVLFR